MQDHTQQDLRNAIEKLPKPLIGFLDSRKLADLYSGIQKKYSFTLQQLIDVADATNLSLVGLETESALETNLHTLMPELSNEKTRELVADINDRIFKEARRRVEENVIEKNLMTLNTVVPPPTEEQLKREKEFEEIEILPDDSAELAALKKQEEDALEERRKKEKEEDEKLVAREDQIPKAPEEISEDAAEKELEWLKNNPDAPLSESPFNKPPQDTEGTAAATGGQRSISALKISMDQTSDREAAPLTNARGGAGETSGQTPVPADKPPLASAPSIAEEKLRMPSQKNPGIPANNVQRMPVQPPRPQASPIAPQPPVSPPASTYSTKSDLLPVPERRVPPQRQAITTPPATPASPKIEAPPPAAPTVTKTVNTPPQPEGYAAKRDPYREDPNGL